MKLPIYSSIFLPTLKIQPTVFFLKFAIFNIVSQKPSDDLRSFIFGSKVFKFGRKFICSSKFFVFSELNFSKFAMERKVTIQLPMKEKKINDNGKVVIENWCVFARFLEKRKRRQQKKTIVISKMSEMEKKRFRDACLKLQRERARMEGPLKRRFKKIASLRSVRSAKSEKSIREPDDEYFACPFDYKTHREGKASKQAESKRLNTVPLKTAMKKDSTKRTKPKIDSTNPAKSKSKVDSGESSKPTISQSGNKAVKRSLLKTKHLPPPPQKFQRPVIIIPPFKTRPWVPCPRPVNPRIKPTTNYPPLTLRKT